MTEPYAVRVINIIHIFFSLVLVGLGITLIVYSFKQPLKPCDISDTTNATVDDTCVGVYIPKHNSDPKKTQQATDDVYINRLIGLIVGFLLIVPLSLNIILHLLKYGEKSDGISVTNVLSTIEK